MCNHRILCLSLVFVWSVFISSGCLRSPNPLPTESLSPSAPPKAVQLQAIAEQEFFKTRDPQLNVVPKERLKSAHALYHRKLQAKRFSVRGAIGGITWTERGPSNVAGRTRAILIDANDATHETLWVGSVSGGLWKTTNISSTTPNWTPVNDFFNNLAITSIVQDPTNSNILYFGTGEGWYNIDAVRGLGIWKSIDGGNSWNALSSTSSNPDFYRIQKLVIASNGDLYACTRQGGLQRSQNGGASWTQILGVGVNSVDEGGSMTDTQVSTVSDLEIDADGNLYCGLGMVFFSDGLYKSTDGGDTWVKLVNGLPTTDHQRVEIACAPSDVNRVYVMFQHASTYQLEGFYQSDDAGSTWTQMATPALGSQSWYNLIAAVDPEDENKVYAGGVGFYRSTNGGSSWSLISGMHPDHHAIVYQPGSVDVMYVGNDGGVYRSTNASQTSPSFSSRNNGYNVTQYYAAAIHPTAGMDYFLAGSQDNGTQRYNSPGMNTTAAILGGDGGFCHIDQLNPDVQIGSYLYGQIYVSTDGFSTYGYRSINLGSTAWAYNPTDYDSRDQTLYAAGTAGQYKELPSVETNNTVVNHPLTELDGKRVTAVSVSPNTAKRIFLGTEAGRILQIDDANGNPTATHLTDGTSTFSGGTWPSSYVSSIAVEEGNDLHLLVTFSNFGVYQVWETRDGGAIWYNRTGDLPDLPVRWGMFYPKDGQQAILATELGVWTTDNLEEVGGPDWEPSHDGNTGFPNVRTDMLRYRESDRTLIAATHGRGLFSAPLPCPVPTEIPTTPGVYTADVSCTDSDGWTYFWNSSQDVLLLAMKDIAANGAVIQPGEVQIEVTEGHGSEGHAISAPYVTNPNGWYVMGRYFNVSPTTQPSSPLSIRFYYDETAYQDVADAIGGSTAAGTLGGHTDLVFYKVKTGLDPNPENGHASISATDIETYVHGVTPDLSTWTYASFGSHHSAEWMVSGFSGGGGGAGGDGGGSGPESPLPVEWLDVRGWETEKGIQLMWVTGEEINLSHFEIQRIGEDQTFHSLGVVYPDPSHRYSFLDQAPQQDLHIFRIKQLDLDGSFSYSPSIEVKIQAKVEITLFPNPFDTEIHLRIRGAQEGSAVQFLLYDVSGKLQSKKNGRTSTGETTFLFPLESLAPGNYQYNLFLDGVRLKQGQVVKY